MATSLEDRIWTLENEADDSYNVGLEYCYNCIMMFLGKSHLELNMNDLTGAIVAYIKEKKDKGAQVQVEPATAANDRVEDAFFLSRLFMVEFS